MVIKNKKNGTNVLAYRSGVATVRVIIKSGQVVDIPSLKDFNQVINKADFNKNRNWFEIIENKGVVEVKEIVVEEKKILAFEETNLERAKKEVKKYTSEKEENKDNN